MSSGKKTLFIFIAIAIVGVGLLVFGSGIFSSTAKPSGNVNPDALPGIQTGSAPWNPELDNLRARLTAIGLPALSSEGTVLHIHQHLDIFINGSAVAVPAGIGINDPAGFISPIHTHDTTAVIHVESPTAETFTLGQFFDIWGVRFTNQCLGGYCSGGQATLRVFVNGQEVKQDFRSIALAEHQEIAVVYGTLAQTPNPVPSAYNFAPGL